WRLRSPRIDASWLTAARRSDVSARWYACQPVTSRARRPAPRRAPRSRVRSETGRVSAPDEVRLERPEMTTPHLAVAAVPPHPSQPAVHPPDQLRVLTARRRHE